MKKVHRNYDPSLHQFEKAKEYTRALNAAKIDRIFAKPFICALPHEARSLTTLSPRQNLHLNPLDRRMESRRYAVAPSA